MILKSFEIDNKKVSKLNCFLLYGENEGLKKEIPMQQWIIKILSLCTVNSGAGGYWNLNQNNLKLSK